MNEYTAKDFKKGQPRWCPGCGDHFFLASLHKAMAEIGVAPWETAVISGIGCSSRLPYYMNTYAMQTIHGRAAAISTGAKVANPNLTVWQISGDGDGLGGPCGVEDCSGFRDGVTETGHIHGASITVRGGDHHTCEIQRVSYSVHSLRRIDRDLDGLEHRNLHPLGDQYDGSGYRSVEVVGLIVQIPSREGVPIPDGIFGP